MSVTIRTYLYIYVCTNSVFNNICYIFIGFVKEEYLVMILGYFSYFSIKTYVVGTHLKHLTEVLQMSTHNICFLGELEKIIP